MELKEKNVLVFGSGISGIGAADLLGAAGAVEFITCVKEIQEGYVHVTRGLEHPDEELDLDYVQGQGVEMDLTYALSNSLGFGGHNASILVKKWAE